MRLGAHFGFAEVGDVAGYLAALGISHVHLPPIGQEVADAGDGPGVTDPDRVSGRFGGEKAFRAMAARLRAHGLGIVVDLGPGDGAVLAGRHAATLRLLAEGLIDGLCAGHPGDLAVTEKIVTPRYEALDLVGGLFTDPAGAAGWAISPADFHAFCRRSAREWQCTETTLSACDTGRHEDVRARLTALTELPDQWTAAVARWRSQVPGGVLEPGLDRLVWQMIAGVRPMPTQGLEQCLATALGEIRARLSPPDDRAVADADEDLVGYAANVMSDPGPAADIAGFAERIAPYARIACLGQKLVHLTMPGVPGVSQGHEVSGPFPARPGDRCAVDYARCRALLADLDAGTIPADLDGEKLLVTSRALRLRGEHPDWFFGDHEPLTAVGPAADHVLAFRRGGAAIMATRLPVGLDRDGGWQGTSLSLPGGPWNDVLTGRSYGSQIPMSGLFGLLPVAILVA